MALPDSNTLRLIAHMFVPIWHSRHNVENEAGKAGNFWDLASTLGKDGLLVASVLT